jgi:hypothetical protein
MITFNKKEVTQIKKKTHVKYERGIRMVAMLKLKINRAESCACSMKHIVRYTETLQIVSCEMRYSTSSVLGQYRQVSVNRTGIESLNNESMPLSGFESRVGLQRANTCHLHPSTRFTRPESIAVVTLQLKFSFITSTVKRTV